MNITVYKIGFRVEKSGALNLLWDAGELVHMHDFKKLAAAGDCLAHALKYRDNPNIMAAWWEARGGHDACTVCHPPESEEVTQ